MSAAHRSPRRSRQARTAWIVGVAVGLVLGVLSGSAPAGAEGTGEISGVITEASDGAAATNVCAEVYSASDTNDAVAADCSDSTGHYSVTGLADGQYVLQFVDGDTVRHDVPQWYNGKADSESADFISVDNGQTVQNIDAVMQAGGWVTGTVTDAQTHDPVSGACVQVTDAAGNAVGGVASSDSAGFDYCAYTADDGSYTTGGLAAGSYDVDVWDDGYASQSEQVDVAVGQPTTQDVAVQMSGVEVSGTVRDATGPVADALVEFSSDSVYQTTWTNDDGTYTITLPAGTYTVQFTADGYAPQWYDNRPDANSADSLTLTDGDPATGIDATLISGGSITGTVTDATSHDPVPGIAIYTCPIAGGSCQFAESAADGSYVVTDLPTGSYSVDFYGEEYGGYTDPATGDWVATDTRAYLSQLYPNTILGQGDGGSVSVKAGETTSGIDDAAVHGATFSGTIADASTGAPLGNVCVRPMPETDSDSAYYPQGICTDDSGQYTTYGLPTGSYQLDFTNYGGRYIEQWWNDKPDQDSADALSVTAPGDTPGLAVQMHLGGTVSGTVTDSNGDALSNVCLTLIPKQDATDPNAGVYGGCTSDDGTYTSSAVAAGDYYVEFIDDSGNYATQYYDGAASLTDATAVTVSTGKDTPGIDAALTAQTVPGAPTNVSASAGDGAATLTWTAPADTGGSPITGYTVTPSPACASCTGLTSDSTSATVRGLTNGTSYTFTVSATNSTGTGPESAPSNAVTPAPQGGGTTAPGAPTNVSATVHISTVHVSWSAPASDGGAAISGYTITPSPSCTACSGLTPTGTESTIDGLTTGTTYTFTVTATNSVGTSPASVSSNPVTPTAQPVEPVSDSTSDAATPATANENGTTATASGGTGTVTVAEYPTNPAAAATYPSTGAFLDVSVSSASTFNSVVIKDCNLHGGSSLYWWNPDASGGGAWQGVVGHPTDTSGLPTCLSVTLDNSSSPRVDQLGGTIFGVASPTSGGGGGSASAPGAPTAVHAVAGDAQASVSWTAPASDGGATIEQYAVTSSPGGKTCTWTAGPLSCTVSGLTNGTAYTFTVTATNSAGTSPASAATTPVTPEAAGGYAATGPARVLDTRTGLGARKGQVGPAASITLTVPNLPAGTSAVVLDLAGTHLRGAGSSYVSACPAAMSLAQCKATSVLNVVPKVDVANEVTVPVGADGKIRLYNNAGGVDLVADVEGYLTGAGGG